MKESAVITFKKLERLNRRRFNLIDSLLPKRVDYNQAVKKQKNHPPKKKRERWLCQ